MFHDYMRNRLGLSPTTPIQAGPMNPEAPPGFNPHPFHPIMNPQGWQNHPMNPNMGATIPSPTPIQAPTPFVNRPNPTMPSDPSMQAPPIIGGPDKPQGRMNPYMY